MQFCSVYIKVSSKWSLQKNIWNIIWSKVTTLYLQKAFLNWFLCCTMNNVRIEIKLGRWLQMIIFPNQLVGNGEDCVFNWLNRQIMMTYRQEEYSNKQHKFDAKIMIFAFKKMKFINNNKEVCFFQTKKNLLLNLI